METLKLQEAEYSEMKQFYQEEYEKTFRRLQHIRTILTRFGIVTSENGTLEPEIIPRPLSGGTMQAKAIPKRKKKASRKSKWELLIMKRLRQLDRPVTYDELTDEIMAFLKLPAEKRRSTKQAIVNVIFRLRQNGKKLDTFSMGIREKYIALKSWFESPGKIKKEYAARINLKQKAGRSRKKARH